MNQKVVLLSLLILAACSSPTPEVVNSGIQGQVFIGPMCPVMQIGQECPDQPYQAILTVNNLKGERIVQIQTDEEGRFRIPLQPGEYILHPESPNVMPFAAEQFVVVEEGIFSQMIVNYDSGIR